MPKNKNFDDEQKQINPTNMAGATKLLRDPEAMDRAISQGLGKVKATPDPTYDDTRRKRK